MLFLYACGRGYVSEQRDETRHIKDTAGDRGMSCRCAPLPVGLMESVLRNYREHEMELACRMDALLRYLSTSEGLLDKPVRTEISGRKKQVKFPV